MYGNKRNKSSVLLPLLPFTQKATKGTKATMFLLFLFEKKGNKGNTLYIYSVAFFHSRKTKYKRRIDMFFKDEDSKQKYCPFQEALSCDGSKCAMWRWEDLLKTEKYDFGYCGLAGRPDYLDS